MLKDRLEANNQPRRLNIHTRGTDESIYLRKHKVHQEFPEILAFYRTVICNHVSLSEN